MGWTAEEFGASHEGWAGALLADGTEPGPVSLDPGGGRDLRQTREWWAYTGILDRPRAAAARAACACGWRGAAHYPVDPRPQDPSGLYEQVIEGPRDDWERHLDEVEARTVPLPAELADLLDRVEDQLNNLAGQAPVAALKAVAALERITRSVARDAAYIAEADDLSWESIATALGISEKEARSRLTHYTCRR
ncbi:hypothetical protein EDD96_6400 [Streptomyces sp. Ag109_G2-6]|uniref:hypothetical protein n=1 Tax=Streptomyces TaxID=1883 RepID=UPI0009A475FB|nr:MULTISPECIES: hypothetical protein [Streptomyces]RPF29856.1 hypothetical protein EDD96_6400 [Streptomyces sp. Ag109_G2-6]